MPMEINKLQKKRITQSDFNQAVSIITASRWQFLNGVKRKESAMKVWKNCRFDTLYYHADADVSDMCDVVIDGDNITVSYDADGLRVTYYGLMKGNGHFELQAPDVSGQATLHRFDEGRILEGYWVEGSMKGMWRITLHGTNGTA